MADIDRKRENYDLYGKGHTILYPAAQSGNPEILEVLMKEKNAYAFLKKEKIHKNHEEWENFVCDVCASGCQTLCTDILNLDETGKEMNCKDRNGATPLIR